VLGAVAELERNLIKERIATGLGRARKQKKTLGRPSFSETRPRHHNEVASFWNTHLAVVGISDK